MRVVVLPSCSVACALLTIAPAGAQAAQGQEKSPEIVVTAAPPAVRREDGRVIYSLDGNLQAASGSASDVLTTLPSVSVSANGNVRVRGESVEILVDGKPSPSLRGVNLGTALQSMPANSIAKIEVITAPGPEFRTNAATIINIVMKRPTGAALKGEIAANIGAPYARRNGSLSASDGFGKWVLSGTAGIRQDIRYDILDLELISRDAAGLDRNRRTEYRSTFVPFTNATASLSADYTISEIQSLRVSAEGAIRHRPRTYSAANTLTDLSTGASNSSTTDDQADQRFDFYSLAVTLNRKSLFGDDSLAIGGSYEYHFTKRNSVDTIVSQNGVGAIALVDQSQFGRNKISKLNLDYEVSLPKNGVLKLGFEAEDNRDRTVYGLSVSNNDGTSNGPSNSDSQINQDLIAAYVEYKRPIGEWTIKGGLRFEHLRHQIQSTAFSGPLTISDSKWSPSFSLSRDITERSSLSLTYSRRVERPTSDQLSPILTIVNSERNVGNTDLRAATIDKINFAYKKGARWLDASINLYASKLSNEILEVYLPVRVADTSLISTYQNAGAGSKIGISLSFNIRPSSKWALNFDLDGYREQKRARDGVAIVQASALSYLAKADMTWKPTARDVFQIQAQSSGRSLIAGGFNLGYKSINIAYSHKFEANLKLVASVTNLLDSVRYTDLLDYPQFSRRSVVRVPGPFFYVGITYKFGAATPSK